MSINVRLSPRRNINVSTNLSSPLKFEDLVDFDSSNVRDKYVIMYDLSTQKYKAVNPDEVLSAATTEPISPGLPSDFKDQLDVDLDDRIDLDAGTF